MILFGMLHQMILFKKINLKKYRLILTIKKMENLLECIEEQTEEICELAVQQNGLALKYVKDEFKTEELCKLAVQQDGYALEFVKDELQTEEICKLAIEQNENILKNFQFSLRSGNVQSKEICKLITIFST